jgi:outer membrane protein TolC
MSAVRLSVGCLLAVFLCGNVAADQTTVVQLHLRDAVRQAVAKNLDVRAELYSSAIAEAELQKNRGIYDTRLTLLTDFNDSTLYSPSSITAGKQSVLRINPGVSQLLNTGGTLGLVFNNTYNHNNSPVALNNYWQSDISVEFSQPLMKNFGKETTELGIMVSAYGKKSALERFKSRLMDTVARAVAEYYKLYSLREAMEVRKTSLTLAQKILFETQGRVKAGVLPAMEILNAEFGLAGREKDIIDAERALADQQDVLRQFLQLDATGEIIPVDPPSRQSYPMAETEAMARAQILRPELQDSRFVLNTLELQAKVAINRTRPDLALTAGAALTGLGKGYGRDMERVASLNYPVWNVGLTIDYPLGNNAAENEAIKARLSVEQSRTQLKNLEQSVANEVKSAVRGVIAGFKQLEVTEKGVAFAEERLKSFVKKSEVGLATIKDVLDVENDLTTARNNRINALVTYVNTVTQLWRSTGEILDREGVRLDEKEADSLYEGSR